MKKEKSNIEYLGELLQTIKGLVPKEGEEAIEFYEAICAELEDAEDEVKDLKEKVSDLEDQENGDEEKDDPDYANETNLGLDILRWELVNGNIVIDGLIENFIESVQKKYAVVPA